MPWLCLGCVLVVSRVCLGGVLVVSRAFRGCAWGASWMCLDCVLIVYWLCIGCVLVVCSLWVLIVAWLCLCCVLQRKEQNPNWGRAGLIFVLQLVFHSSAAKSSHDNLTSQLSSKIL